MFSVFLLFFQIPSGAAAAPWYAGRPRGAGPRYAEGPGDAAPRNGKGSQRRGPLVLQRSLGSLRTPNYLNEQTFSQKKYDHR